MLEYILPAGLFATSMCIKPVRDTYMSFINRIHDTCTLVKMAYQACISGDINMGFVKDYSLHRARNFSSHHLNLGKLEYDKKLRIYDLTYYKNGTEFHVVIPQNKCSRGPRSARKFYEIFEFGETRNITDEIIPKLGITKDFHSIPTTPRMLGYPYGIKIVYNNGEERVYVKNERISLIPPKSV